MYLKLARIQKVGFYCLKEKLFKILEEILDKNGCYYILFHVFVKYNLHYTYTSVLWGLAYHQAD